MKHIKRGVPIVWLGLMSLGLSLLNLQPAQASSAIYNIQFTQFASDAHQTGPAVIGSSGDSWNVMTNASGSSVLLNSGGISSTVSISWSANGIYHFSSTFGGGNAALMGGYIYASSSHGVSFAGLPANQIYTLYIYSQSDMNGREISITVNGSTYTTTPSAFPTNFIAGQNYLAITGVTDGGGNISFTYNVAIGEADLDGIQLSISNTAPAIITQPSNQVVAAGGTVNLSVAVSGTAPLAYQWFKNGGILLSATNSSLNLTVAGVTNSGVYYLVITNSLGLTISRPVTVTVGNLQLLAWGDNEYGQLGNGTTSNASSPALMMSNVMTMAAGGDHSLLVKTDNTLWAVGYNGDGELDDGTTNDIHVPESVATNVVAVAAGAWHSLFLKGDGTLWAVGQNFFGELGDGTTTSESFAEFAASNVVAMVAGYDQSLFLKADGTLWAMGQNGSGELGDGTTTQRNRPVNVASNVVAVAAGAWHSLFLKSDRTLWAMGDNSSGQLGDGTTTQRNSPVNVASNVVAMAAGADHSLFLKSDGTLWAMGGNGSGQLGDGTTMQRNSPVSVTGLSLASVVSGCYANHTLAVGLPTPPPARPVITGQPTNQTVMVGSNAIFIVTANGIGLLSYQWQFNGANISGAVATNYGLTDITTNNAGNYTVVVSNVGGSVTSSVAVLTVLLPTPPPVITIQPDSQTVTVSSNVTFNITADGVGPLSYQWQFNGTNLDGAVATNYDLTDVTTNNAGDYTVVVSNAGGSVTSSVAALTVLLPMPPPPPAITIQPISQTVAEGTPVELSISATGDGLSYQWLKDGRMISGATNNTLNIVNASMTNSGVYFVAITNASGFVISQPVTIAVGTPQLLAWGEDWDGQLGDGTTTIYPPVDLPETITGNVVAAAAGDAHSLFVKGDGTLWTMGENWEGQLGNGTTTEQNNPVLVTSNVVAVAAGWAHSLFIKSDGTLWGMGDNGFGELGGGFGFEWLSPGLVASNVVAVAADAWGSLYIKNDGTLWVKGGNRNGELGNGSTTSPIASNVVAVAAGAFHTLYLTGDGTMWAMGANADGELGDGTTNDVSVPESISSNVVAVAAGNNFSLFVKNDGTLWAMGANQCGQLGDGSTISRNLPECVASNVVSVTAGTSFSLFLTGDGTMWAMGDNREGQLGDGTTTQQNSPEAITSVSLANVVSGSMADHTLAVGISLAPVITSQPVSQTVLEGTPVTFTVTATDAGPITYQWQNYDFDIDGATNTTYVIPSAGMGDGGWYSVVVTGLRGVAVSQTADLTITNIPVPMANITVSANPPEAGFVNGGGSWPIGNYAMLTATGTGNWLFVNWNDGSTNNPYNIIVPDTDTNYTANFAPAAILMLYASPEEGGSATGTGTFVIGSTNPITAVASNGWAFVQWSDGSTNNSENIVVTSNMEFTASFAPATIVTTVASPPTAGSTAGGGSYAIGSNAILTATPSNGWAFVNWNGTVTNNPWTFLVPTNPAVCTANFAPASTVTALVNPTNAGSVSGGGIIFVGSNTVLTATASNNWVFVSWNDGVTNNSRVVTVPATNITYTADFAATATITVLASPSSAGTVSGGGTFLIGSTNLITATATNGWIFTGWSDGTTSGSDFIVATSNRTYTASFAPAATVTIVVYPTNAGVVVTGGGTYRIGSNATLSASMLASTNQNRWKLLNWNGTVTNYTKYGNTNNPLNFKVTSDITVTANCAQVTSDGFVYTYIWVQPPPIIIKVDASKAKTMMTPENTTLVQGIEIIGYDGDATSIIVPGTIDGVTVNEIGPGALSQEKFESVDFADDVSDMTLDGTSIDADELDLANISDFDGLLEAGEFVIEGDAVADCSGVLLAAGLSGAALGILADIFSDLSLVQVNASPSSGGHGDGSGLYFDGINVEITAVPNDGWRFGGWDDGTTTNKLRTITVDGANTYTANFIQQSTVTVLANPPEDAGTVTGSGTYDVDTLVPLTATAEEGWEFHNWSDGSIEETNIIEVPDHDVTYTATFYVEVEGEAEPPTGGTIVGNDSYPEGSPVLLTAIANPGWEFKGWFLEAESTNSTLLTNITTVVVAAEPVPFPLKYKAHFDQILQVTGLASPTNAGSVDGSGTYEVDDTNITLTATATNNWVFVKWDDGTTNNTITITVPPIIVTLDIYTNIVRTAYFAATANITVVTNPINGGFVSGGGTFLVGSTNPIAAVASNGWAFTGWSDGYTNSLHSIVVTSNATYTANFAPVSTVTGLANPTNAGIVTGGAVYFVGSNAVLTATASNSWQFVNWNDGTTNNPYSITVPATNITCTACFAPVSTVTGLANPTNAGIVTGTGVYFVGSNTVLTAIATNTWRFTQWNDGTTNNPYSITVPGTNITYIANFAATAIITVGAKPTNGGTVTGGGTFLVGSTNLITASATNGWLFMGWNDGTTTNRYNIIIPATNSTFTAEFTAGNSTNLTTSLSGKTLTLAWPADHLGWVLQALTNDLSYTNWFDLPGTGGTNLVVISINPATPLEFYRLRQP